MPKLAKTILALALAAAHAQDGARKLAAVQEEPARKPLYRKTWYTAQDEPSLRQDGDDGVVGRDEDEDRDEGEFSYAYDDDMYADDEVADVSAPGLVRPIAGADDVPGQIGALIEGVMGPFLGTFQGLETPLVVRYASLMDAMSWNCIATYHPSWLDALTKQRPALAGAPVETHDTPHRLACILSAAHTFADAFLPGASAGIQAAAAARGLLLTSTLDPRIVFPPPLTVPLDCPPSRITTTA